MTRIIPAFKLFSRTPEWFYLSGVYTLENTPSPKGGGGEYQPISFERKNETNKRNKRGKCEEKRRKDKRGN
jgi:hypothetical protein